MSVVLNTDPVLPDIVDANIGLLFVSLAHTPSSVEAGHFHADPSDRFYELLHQSGLINKSIPAEQDTTLLSQGIGLTTLVRTRAIESVAEIEPTDHSIGDLIKLVFQSQPEVVCFLGEETSRRFFDKRGEYGLQNDTIGEALVFVLPDPRESPNTISFDEKLNYYRELRRSIVT